MPQPGSSAGAESTTQTVKGTEQQATHRRRPWPRSRPTAGGPPRGRRRAPCASAEQRKQCSSWVSNAIGRRRGEEKKGGWGERSSLPRRPHKVRAPAPPVCPSCHRIVSDHRWPHVWAYFFARASPPARGLRSTECRTDTTKGGGPWGRESVVLTASPSILPAWGGRGKGTGAGCHRQPAPPATRHDTLQLLAPRFVPPQRVTRGSQLGAAARSSLPPTAPLVRRAVPNGFNGSAEATRSGAAMARDNVTIAQARRVPALARRIGFSGAGRKPHAPQIEIQWIFLPDHKRLGPVGWHRPSEPGGRAKRVWTMGWICVSTRPCARASGTHGKLGENGRHDTKSLQLVVREQSLTFEKGATTANREPGEPAPAMAKEGAWGEAWTATRLARPRGGGLWLRAPRAPSCQT